MVVVVLVAQVVPPEKSQTEPRSLLICSERAEMAVLDVFCCQFGLNWVFGTRAKILSAGRATAAA